MNKKLKIIWLASYPKSGNTFVRMLLYHYLYGDIQDSEVINSKIPDIHTVLGNKNELNVNINQSVIVKTHFRWSEAHPYSKNSIGFIYILRNPRDVLLSNARYLGMTKNHSELKNFSQKFINQMGVKRWKRMRMGTWPEHVGSWIVESSKIPHIFVKYEHLRQDTSANLKRIVEFLGMEPDDDKINHAVEKCKIDRMRKLEKAEKNKKKSSVFVELPYGEPFVGKGKMNQSLSTIGEEIETVFQNRFNKILSIFSYH